MSLISMREFARRNGVSPEAISRAVKAGRLPSVEGKIDLDQAQPVWDAVKDAAQVGRKLRRRGCQPAPVDTEKHDFDPPNWPVDTSRERVDTLLAVPGPTGDHQLGAGTGSVNPVPVGTGTAVNPPRVDSKSGVHPSTRWYPPPPTNGRDQIAITIPLNGAEELELDKRRAEKALSLPAYLLTTCGYDQWRLEAARDRPARPSRRQPVRHGLERRQVTILVSREVFEDLWRRSEGTGWPVPQFIRTLLGLDVRRYSNPNTYERDHEIEDAWDRLLGLGLDPKVYLPDS